MLINFESDKPIYMQLAEGLEDAILSGIYTEENKIPSTTEISVTYKINPATALKGVNMLVNNDIVYKKRGIGMFVRQGATKKIRDKRKVIFFENYVKSLLHEAKKIGVSKKEIIEMLERAE